MCPESEELLNTFNELGNIISDLDEREREKYQEERLVLKYT